MSKKIIFITGVTSGVGRETARRFIKEGWKVIGTGRRQSRLDELAAELGGDFLPLCFDVAKRDVVVEMFANLPEGFKDIDVLLNNAGSSIGQNPAQAGNMDDWDEMIATNINGLLYCTRCVLPGMIERGSGHIVNIGSVAGNRAFKCGNVYGATKAFVNHFSRMLRCDLLGTPVRVTNIKPGHLHTEFLAVRFKGDLKTSEAAYENLDPLTPENIAESVWWSVNLPAHMDVCDMELMPMCQSDGGWKVGNGDVLIGASQTAAECNGCAKASHIKDKIIEMIHLNETLFSCGIACSCEGSPTRAGNYQIDMLLANVCKQNVTRLPYEIARLAQDIAGGLMVTMPSDADFTSDEVGEWCRKLMVGDARYSVEDRQRILRLIEAMTIGSVAVGYLTESMHGAGSPQAQRIMIGRQANMEAKKALARRLCGIDPDGLF